MNNAKIVLLAVLSNVLSHGLAQGGNDPGFSFRESADRMAARRATEETESRAVGLVKEPGRLLEGIVALQEAVLARRAFERTYGGFSSGVCYELAQALLRANRVTEALAAFKDAFRWDPEKRDITSNGPPFIDLSMDYSIELAKAGRLGDAKAVYYWALRHMTFSNGHTERFPFLVVFDADPTMVVWDLTAEKLITAAMMLRHRDGEKTNIDIIRDRDPGWLIPHLFVWPWDNSTRGRATFDRALELASNAEEREWLHMYDPVFTAGQDWDQVRRRISVQLSEIGVERRKNSAVLRQAKEQMATLHQRLAGSPP